MGTYECVEEFQDRIILNVLVYMLIENCLPPNVKLKQALGIANMPVRAEEGLRKTIDSFQ